jgi:hypothetical protein
MCTAILAYVDCSRRGTLSSICAKCDDGRTNWYFIRPRLLRPPLRPLPGWRFSALPRSLSNGGRNDDRVPPCFAHRRHARARCTLSPRRRGGRLYLLSTSSNSARDRYVPSSRYVGRVSSAKRKDETVIGQASWKIAPEKPRNPRDWCDVQGHWHQGMGNERLRRLERRLRGDVP